MTVGRFTSIASVALLVAALFVPHQALGGHTAGTRGSDTTGTWMEFRGNLNNTGVSTSTVPQTNNFFMNFSVGKVFHSSPTVSTNILYFGSDDGKVYAVNIGTGKKIWEFVTNDAIWATPLVVGSMVYVGSSNDSLYALNRFNGSFQWSFKTNGDIVSSAKYANGTLVFASQDGCVYFVNATTGLQTQPPFVTGGQIWGTPAIVDGTVIIGSNDGNLSRLRLSDKSAVWNHTLSPAIFVKYSSAAVHGDRVFVGSDDSYAYSFDLDTGALVWRFKTGNYVYATPGIHGNRVFIHSTDGNIYAVPFDDPNGDGEITANEILWQFHTGDGTIGEGGSSPAIADGKVLVAARPGYLFCINEITGKLVWNYSTNNADYYSFSSPTVVDGMVFVGLSDGSMYGFAPSAPGMSVSITPGMNVIEGQRAMEIVFNVTVGGMAVEGAFVSFAVSSGSLSQGGASTLADGLQKVKYLAPKVSENTTVQITAKATKYGMVPTTASASIVVVPAQDYGTTSGSAFTLDNYSLLLAVIGVLVAANAVVYVAVLLRKRRRSKA